MDAKALREGIPWRKRKGMRRKVVAVEVRKENALVMGVPGVDEV